MKIILKTVKIIFFAFSYLIFFNSCNDEDLSPDLKPIVKERISGLVQKGPFANGTTIQMNELSPELNQTGKVFSTQILDNSGNFEIKSVELSSSIVEFTANGFYFNEVTGELSSSQITLNAISDIKDITTININLLTHLEKRRVEFLVSEGMVFSDAKKKAQGEVLGIFGLTMTENSKSEFLDISKGSEADAMLLAISVILQGGRSVGQLSELLATISSDIEKDGILINTQILNALRESAIGLDLESVRKNLTNRYSSLSITVTIPSFETYVNQFLTLTAKEPTIGEISITQITANNASFSVLVNPNSLPTSVKVIYGESKESLSFSTEITANPIESKNYVPIFGQMTGLKRITNYFYKISAENSIGKSESQILEFKTTPELPTLTTNEVVEIAAVSAKSGGVLTNNGGGEITEKGVVWGLNQNPTIDLNSKKSTTETSASFAIEFSNLEPATTYYLRAYAISQDSTAYGNEVNFKTRDGIAKISTIPPFNIKATTINSGGIINDNGGAQIIDKGVVWNSSPQPITNQISNGNGLEEFISVITNLSPGQVYYLRSFAKTIVGTSYGNEVNFKTDDGLFNSDLSYGTVTDIDGNSYKTIKIGSQVWMAENLRTTKFNTGTLIPVLTSSDWGQKIEGLYNYLNEQDRLKYGKLYNGYAANNITLCPIGWHVPSPDEFSELFIFLGGESNNLNMNLLRSVGGWEGLVILNAQNQIDNKTNLSGLSLLPNGTYVGGVFSFVGTHTYLWPTNYQFTNENGSFFYNSGGFRANLGQKYRGACIRCVKDN
jgi:uncharacterized protein (TIGR02145 family)